MQIKKENWIGRWENFENYIFSKDPYITKAWNLVESSTKNIPMFKNGPKEFWKKTCSTINKENLNYIYSWEIQDSNNGLLITWFDKNHEILFESEYLLINIFNKGLENKNNFIFQAQADLETPFKYILAMEPMPEKDNLISHFHYQFASKLENLIQAEKLVNPYWYATMCNQDCTVLDQCNIILALHKLPTWNAI